MSLKIKNTSLLDSGNDLNDDDLGNTGYLGQSKSF